MNSAVGSEQEKRKLRFSDFAAEPQILDGAKISIDRILNQEIEIIGFRISKSKYQKNKTGQCLTLQIVYNNDRHVVFTGSDVLIAQLERYGEKIPFFTMIKKIDKYFTLS